MKISHVVETRRESNFFFFFFYHRTTGKWGIQWLFLLLCKLYMCYKTLNYHCKNAWCGWSSKEDKGFNQPSRPIAISSQVFCVLAMAVEKEGKEREVEWTQEEEDSEGPRSSRGGPAGTNALWSRSVFPKTTRLNFRSPFSIVPRTVGCLQSQENFCFDMK